MKRRKNADDTLRKAERAYEQNKNVTTRAAYWKASLRAGILPSPTYVSKLMRINEWCLNEEEYAAYHFERAEQPDAIVIHLGAVTTHLSTVEKWSVTTIRSSKNTAIDVQNVKYFIDLKDAEEEVKKRLSKVLEKENPARRKRPRRHNADDALRKAERAYHASRTKSNKIAYWRACLQAGIIPPHDFVDSKVLVWHTNEFDLSAFKNEVSYYVADQGSGDARILYFDSRGEKYRTDILRDESNRIRKIQERLKKYLNMLIEETKLTESQIVANYDTDPYDF